MNKLDSRPRLYDFRTFINPDQIRVGVLCPDCGSGGASTYPCWCSRCHQTMMLPAINGRIVGNWAEAERLVKLTIVG